MGTPAKRRWSLILRIIVPIVVCLALLVADSMGLIYPLARMTGDAMDWKSRYLVGLGGVNCGRVKVRGDPSAATQCALQADTKAQPFRVSYNVQGFDAFVAGGIVRTPSGKHLALSYDSCPRGCGFSFLRQRVRVAPCPQPYHLYVNPKGRINCFQPQLSYPKNLMSPNFEPY
jgi:hypothetical protein